MTNMINGLIIMFSDQLSLGDQIRVGEFRGKVLDITLINVVLQNDDDDIVLIPNSVIFSTMVLNQSKQNIKKLTIEFELDLKYQSSPDDLEKELKGVLRPFATNITENSFSLKILEIKKDLVHYKVQFLIPRPDKGNRAQDAPAADQYHPVFFRQGGERAGRFHVAPRVPSGLIRILLLKKIRKWKN